VITVSEPLQLTVVYEDAGDGWVMATIPEVPGAVSQGRGRDEARENVCDALREILLHRLQVGTTPTVIDGADSDTLELIISR